MVKIAYDKQIISERIKGMRKEKGWTQKELSARSGVSVEAIKLYETAKRVPDKFNRQELSKVFRVNEEYLLGKTEFKNFADRYDKEHQEEVKHSSYEVQLLETAEKLGLYTINSDDPEKDSSDFINYIKNYQERKEKIMKLSDVKVVASETINEVRENFETGEITIYASSEENVRKAIDQLIKRGMVEE
ncbi:MAG: helix-turn-helix domain-containing protein [Fusicatenibacter sp.]|nr:helix-turn-helix domain-containing protein [Fusicatenibacter sp.]